MGEVHRTLADGLDRLIGSFPDFGAMADALKEAHRTIGVLMGQRHPGKQLKTYGGGGGPTPPPEVWLSAAHALIQELNEKRLPLTSGGKDRDWQKYSAQYTALHGHYQSVLDKLYKTAHVETVRLVREYGHHEGALGMSQPLTVFPAAETKVDALPDALAALVPGMGPVRLSLGGLIGATEVAVTVVSGDGRHREDISVDVPPSAYPAVIDLDETGGFRTDEPKFAERVILELLVSLPADQLTVRVFDPVKLGESAKFLYGLDKLQERVIGDKVMTTDRELDALLQETEEHITRVTQKYLQGEHDTLTSYNQASKMVTEPYRVLLLYGFPAGFQKQNHPDVDQLERLAKIIDGGSRTGVFTIIVAEETVGTRNSYIRALPWIGDGTFLEPKAFTALTGLSRSAMHLRLRRMKNGMGAGFETCAIDANPGPGEVELRHAPLYREAQHEKWNQLVIARVAETFNNAKGTVIRPGWVAGLVRRPDAAQPYDPATWWRNSTREGAAAHVGQLGASDVADLNFHSNSGGVGALIGGQPGSGKSVLLHSMIMSLALEYSPQELEMYLIDFKQGVEFKCYADSRLPHAKAVAIEAEREFGIAVLEGMVAEIVRRGDLFKAAGPGKLDDYRAQTGEVLARQIVIIDEFQKLFEKDDRLAQTASNLLEQVLREGRAFGLHVVLASQTIAGMAGLDRHVMNLVPTRVALRMGAADSEMVLGEGNVEAKHILRGGEGIINTKQGNPDANQRFQATLWQLPKGSVDGDRSDMEDVLAALRAKADAAGITAEPRVFAGSERGIPTRETLGQGDLPVGLPLSLAPAVSYGLRREGGANLLVVDDGFGSIVTALLAAVASGRRVRIVDLLVGDDEWSAMRSALEAVQGVNFVGKRSLPDVLRELKTTVEERVEFEDYNNPAEILVLFGLHRARDFDPDDYDEESLHNLLAGVVRDGPEVGIHVYAWADRAGILGRRFSSQVMREFGYRLVGPTTMEDSQSLVDSDAAATLKPNQAVFDDHERGYSVRVLAYGSPAPAAIAELVR